MTLVTWLWMLTKEHTGNERIITSVCIVNLNRTPPELSVCLWFLHRLICEGAPAVWWRRWCWCWWSSRWCWGWWRWHWRPHCPAPSPWGASTCLCLIHGYCQTFTLPTSWHTKNRSWSHKVNKYLYCCQWVFNMLFWNGIMSLTAHKSVVMSKIVIQAHRKFVWCHLVFYNIRRRSICTVYTA